MHQYLITALIDLAVGCFALTKKENPAATALALTAFSCGVWSIELYFLSTLNYGSLLDVLFHVTRWGMFLIPPCFALLAWRVSGSRSVFFLRTVVLPGFIAAIVLGVLNLFFFPSVLEPTEQGHLPQVDGIFYGFVVVFFWCFLGSIPLPLLLYNKVTNREKQRVKWLLITLTVCCAGGAVGLFAMPHEHYLSKYTGSIINIVFVALLFYLVIQHHLMDLRTALSVGIARAILLGFIVWSFFMVMSIIGPMGQSPGGMLAFAALIVFALELYPRLLQWFLPSAKKLIASDSYDFDKTKIDFQYALNECVNFYDLVHVLDHYLLQVIKVGNYAVHISDSGAGSALNNFQINNQTTCVKPVSSDDFLLRYCARFDSLVMTDEAPLDIQKEFLKNKSSLNFCVKFEDEPVAVVMMGASQDLSYYRYDDIRVFEWLKVEMGQVIRRINQLDAMQDQLGQAKKTLSMLGLMNHYHHDIKAPLAIIDGVLSNDVYDKEKQKDIVLQQVERGSRLIATMAGILKGERKRQIQELSLTEVVKDSLFLFSQGIDSVNTDFNDTPQIRGDAEDLKILVINLVKNAMEARREGVSLELTVSVWQIDGYACLSIADTGVGMSEEKMRSLWTDMVSSKQHGSGIGLQAIRRIADEHAAEIEVLSEEGKGTEFIFRFPINFETQGEPEPMADADSQTPYHDESVNKPMAS